MKTPSNSHTIDWGTPGVRLQAEELVSTYNRVAKISREADSTMLNYFTRCVGHYLGQGNFIGAEGILRQLPSESQAYRRVKATILKAHAKRMRQQLKLRPEEGNKPNEL